MIEKRKKRYSLELKKEILGVIAENPNISYGAIEKKVNTDWLTVKRHCEELKFFESITIDNNKMSITPLGRNLLHKEVKSNREEKKY